MGDQASKIEADEKSSDLLFKKPMMRARFQSLQRKGTIIVYPEGLQDIPGAAAWLLLKSRKPFVLTSRQKNNISSPCLDLSHLQRIYVKKNRLYVSVGATNGQLVKELTGLEGNLYLDAVLDHNPDRTILGSLLDDSNSNDDLRKCLVGLLVTTDLHNGAIIRCSLYDFKKNSKQGIIVMIILQLSEWNRKTGRGKPFKRSWIMKGDKSTLAEIPPAGRLFWKAEIILCKRMHGLPFAVVTADADGKIPFTRKNWNRVTAQTKLDYSRQKQAIFREMNLWKLKYRKTFTVPKKTWNALEVDYLAFMDAFLELRDQVVMRVKKEEVSLCFNMVDEFETLKENTKLNRLLGEGKQLNLMQYEIPPEIDAQNRQHFQKLNPNTAHAEPLLGTVIPGFTGAVYDKNHPKYQNSREQYATSTFGQYMHPEAIAYPDSLRDVIAAIKYAKTHNLKVVGRSGGHNYCGVSCDSGALVLSMNNFNEVNVYPVERKIGNAVVKWEAVVGVGVNLDTVSKKFAQHGLSIPMGECPCVGVGGHIQTGGYGHTLRSFGVTVDYVYEFTIVSSDGSVRRPKRDSEDEADRSLFWAVTGGSPGAFGIVTSVVFHPIHDHDWPNSTGYKVTAAINDQLAQTALEIIEDFTNTCKDSDDRAAPLIDINCTIGSNFIHGPQHVLLFEMVCKDMKDTKAYDYFLSMKKKIEKELSPMHVMWISGEGHHALSEISLVFVRQPPGVTKDGRENPNPYQKACYGTNSKLPLGFAKAMTGLIYDLIRVDNDTSLIFQCAVGGGEYSRKGKAHLNALGHRDARLWIVFDIFRPNKKSSIETATRFQERFQKEIVEVYLTTNPKIVPLWATACDALDMDKPEVWEQYYDKHEDYYRLREIKAVVDPDDLFHSRFTIRPLDKYADEIQFLEEKKD